MIGIISMFMSKRHYFIVEETGVTEVLTVINDQESWFVEQELAVGNCGWADETTKWYIHFNASKKQWNRIVSELSDMGYQLNIMDGTRRVYLSKI